MKQWRCDNCGRRKETPKHTTIKFCPGCTTEMEEVEDVKRD